MSTQSSGFVGYTERNFPRYHDTGPHPIVLAFECEVQEALRGTGIQITYRSTGRSGNGSSCNAGDEFKQAVDTSTEDTQVTSTASAAVQPAGTIAGQESSASHADSSRPIAPEKKKSKAAQTNSKLASSQLAFGTRVGAGRTVPRKTASSLKDTKNTASNTVNQTQVCRW